MEKIIDLTEYYPSAIKAEQRKNDILILRKLEKPFKTWSKAKLSHYELEYQWINPATGGVLGNEFTYWNKRDLDLNKSLFEQVNLF